MKNIIIIITIVLLISCANTGMLDAAPQQAGTDALRETSFSHLQLKGTLFTESMNPLAVVEDTRSGQIMMYELGDNIEGLKISRISRGIIVLSLKGEEYTLSFTKGGVLQPSMPSDSSDNWYNIRKDGQTVITDRATVTNAVLRARHIMKDLKIGPYSEDGKTKGIAITKLNEEGVLREIGIKQGDIIKAINGLTLNSPYQIFNAYRKLKNKDELKVEIIRNQNPLTLTYRVEK
jgi:general secretion pathway protein C